MQGDDHPPPEGDCPFCELLRKGLPAHVVYEDERLFVMLDRESLAFGHCMVIPKKHGVKIYQMEDEDYFGSPDMNVDLLLAGVP